MPCDFTAIEEDSEVISRLPALLSCLLPMLFSGGSYDEPLASLMQQLTSSFIVYGSQRLDKNSE